jgi:hypothetical protein
MQSETAQYDRRPAQVLAPPCIGPHAVAPAGMSTCIVQVHGITAAVHKRKDILVLAPGSRPIPNNLFHEMFIYCSRTRPHAPPEESPSCRRRCPPTTRCRPASRSCSAPKGSAPKDIVSLCTAPGRRKAALGARARGHSGGRASTCTTVASLLAAFFGRKACVHPRRNSVCGQFWSNFDHPATRPTALPRVLTGRSCLLRGRDLRRRLRERALPLRV